jgi:hypothetical protein
MRARRSLIGGLAAAIFLLAVPTADAVTTTIGQVAPAGTTDGCGECSSLQLSVAPGTASYVVPPVPAGGGAWTLTAWSGRANVAHVSQGQALVWRPTQTAGEFSLVAITGVASIPMDTAPSIPVSIPVQPGDVLGLRTGDDPADMPLAYDAAAQDVELGVSTDPGEPTVGQTTGTPTSDLVSTPFVKKLLNVAATLTSPDPVVPPAKKAKCKKKKKKHKRSAESAKKKKCKKKKKKH